MPATASNGAAPHENTDYPGNAAILDSTAPAKLDASLYGDKVADAVGLLNASLAAGAIRNADLNAVKSKMARAFESAWENGVTDQYIALGKWKELPEKLYDVLFDSPELHTIASMRKKLDKAPAHPARASAIAVLMQWQPVQDAINFLKARVVKGAAPQQKAAPTNLPESDVAEVLVNDNGKGYTYTAVMKDGSKQVIRKNATTRYEKAFHYAQDVAGSTKSGLARMFTFGKEPSSSLPVIRSLVVKEA